MTMMMVLSAINGSSSAMLTVPIMVLLLHKIQSCLSMITLPQPLLRLLLLSSHQRHHPHRVGLHVFQLMQRGVLVCVIKGGLKIVANQHACQLTSMGALECVMKGGLMIVVNGTSTTSCSTNNCYRAMGLINTLIHKRLCTLINHE